MINKQKLKGAIVENSYTYKDCANALNISNTAFCNKITGKSPFKTDEVKILMNLLYLSQDEMMNIFFTNNLARKARFTVEGDV